MAFLDLPGTPPIVTWLVWGGMAVAFGGMALLIIFEPVEPGDRWDPDGRRSTAQAWVVGVLFLGLPAVLAVAALVEQLRTGRDRRR